MLASSDDISKCVSNYSTVFLMVRAGTVYHQKKSSGRVANTVANVIAAC